MIFGDIVALAKAGFTPADIREFMQKTDASASDNGSPIPPSTSEDTSDGAAHEESTPAASEQPAQPSGASEDANKIAELEKQLAELSAQSEKLKADLTAAQKVNTGRDLSGSVGDQDKALDDLVRSFM